MGLMNEYNTSKRWRPNELLKELINLLKNTMSLEILNLESYL